MTPTSEEVQQGNRLISEAFNEDCMVGMARYSDGFFNSTALGNVRYDYIH
jgi:hypothetical protein